MTLLILFVSFAIAFYIFSKRIEGTQSGILLGSIVIGFIAVVILTMIKMLFPSIVPTNNLILIPLLLLSVFEFLYIASNGNIMGLLD